MNKPTATKASAGGDGQLTAQQRIFVAEYLKDFNATQAAIRAKYSTRNAGKIGPALLGKSRISAAVAKAMQKRVEKTEIDANWLLTRLAEEATADIADIYDDDGNLLPVKEWPKIWRTGLVAGIEIEEQYADDDEPEVEFEPQAHGGALKRATKHRRATGRVTKIKQSDRIKRLELLGKHVDVQAWKERKEISADEPLRELMREIGGASIKPKESTGE